MIQKRTKRIFVTSKFKVTRDIADQYGWLLDVCTCYYHRRSLL